MIRDGRRIQIDHIRIGFAGVVGDPNYSDSHRPLPPFGMKWGRGLLIRGGNYLECVTGPYGCSHSQLKQELGEDEISNGSFYFGFEEATKTLYLEYGADRTFDLHDQNVLDAIMNALKQGREPFKDFIVGVK